MIVASNNMNQLFQSYSKYPVTISATIGAAVNSWWSLIISLSQSFLKRCIFLTSVANPSICNNQYSDINLWCEMSANDVLKVASNFLLKNCLVSSNYLFQVYDEQIDTISSVIILSSNELPITFIYKANTKSLLFWWTAY